MMKLLGSTKSKITKSGIGDNVPNLEITEEVLVHCNIVKNNYQNYSRDFYTFLPNKSSAHLQDISPKHFILLKTFNSEFSYIEMWLTILNKILNH